MSRSQLATIAGTSIREIEDTYHRWLTRTDDRLLAAFDTYDHKAAEAGRRRNTMKRMTMCMDEIHLDFPDDPALLFGAAVCAAAAARGGCTTCSARFERK